MTTFAVATNRLDSVLRTLPDRAIELAYHAALPVAVNVEFLHLLRMNFLDDLPWEIEAQLLLSPLFRDLGEDLYEIEPELRTILLIGLSSRFGPDRLRQVALLLEQYSEQTLAWDEHPELDYAQRLTALHVIDPETAETWLNSNATGFEADLNNAWHFAVRRHLDTRPPTDATLDHELLTAIARLDAAQPGAKTTAVRAVGVLGALPGTDPAPAVRVLHDMATKGSPKERGQATAALVRLGTDIHTDRRLEPPEPLAQPGHLETSTATHFHFTDMHGAEWKYDDRSRIGDSSGMGSVFRGTGLDGTPVAVKRVRLPYPDLSAERRRQREVQIIDLLIQIERSGNETSGLVVPLGYQFVGDDLYIVMPLADESLRHTLNRGPFELSAGVDVVRQVARGLEQLAAASIVHRDLKPENVLRYGPTWKITDFGLSKSLSEGPATVSLAGWGTEAYTAPELWNNQPATPRSDLYALGVSAFEVFTGARPFPGPHGEYRRQHLQNPPPDLRELPPRLARLILRLLAKNPAERPQDARAVVEVLDTYARRLRPAQVALIDAAFEAERTRNNEQASDAIARADAEHRETMRLMAVADLSDVLADAYEDIHEALPDARIDRTTQEILIGGSRIAFETSEPLRLSAAADDQPIRTGVVRLLQSTGPRRLGTVFAHLVYAAEPDGRHRWSYTGPDPTDVDRQALDNDTILAIVRTVLAAAAQSRDTRPPA